MSEDCDNRLRINKKDPRYLDGTRESAFLECLEYDVPHDTHFTTSCDVDGNSVEITWKYTDEN